MRHCPTISDIAAASGCSPSTVSSILSGSKTNIRFSKATRQKVINASKKIKYKRPSSHGIGVLYSTGPSNPKDINWISEISPMLTSIHDASQKKDKVVSVCAYSARAIREMLEAGKLPRAFGRRMIDGLIISGRLEQEALEELKTAQLPYVLMNMSDAQEHHFDSVTFDDIHTGLDATNYLINNGRSRIVHVSVDWDIPHYSIDMRRHGYEMAMARAGLTGQLILSKQKEEEDFARRFRALLTGPNRPDGLFVYSENLAVFCYRIMIELGLSLNDVAMVAPSWAYTSMFMMLGVMYIELPAAEMGRQALAMLTRKISDDMPIPSVSLRGALCQSSI